MLRILNKFNGISAPGRAFFSSYFKKGDISTDLLLTLSMQQSDKKHANHHELVESLVNRNLLKTDSIIQAMKDIDRAYFFENVTSKESNYYYDKPYDIGHGEKISAPMMHAITTEALFPPTKALLEKGIVNFIDVGTGSGYVAVLFYHIFSKILNPSDTPQLFIRGLDLYDTFMRNTNLALASMVDKQVLKVNNSIEINFYKQDFYQYLNSLTLEGYENKVINIGAAIEEKTYKEIKRQIDITNGSLLAPVLQQDGEQSLMFYSKIGDTVEENSLMKVIYSPLKPFHEAKKASEEINKYFIDDKERFTSKGQEDEDEEPMAFKESPIFHTNMSTETDQQRYDRTSKEVAELEAKVKEWHKAQISQGKKLSLAEMQNDPQMKAVLETLNKQKRILTALKKKLGIN